MSDALSRIEARLNDVATDVAVIREKVSDQKDDIERLSHCVEGNGKIGLKTEVEMLKRARKKTDTVVTAIVVALASTFVSYVLGIIN